MGNDETDRNITYAGQAVPATYPSGRTYFACRVCGGDEWDVFDTEHLPHKMDAGTFYSYAQQLADLDDAGDLERITALAGWLGTNDLDALIEYDTENYVGQYDTFQDYAETYADEVALLADTPEWIARYFDMEAFSRDLAHDFYHDDTTGHTWRSC
jgi:antirestriction protein